MDDIIYRTNTGIKSSNTYNHLFSVDENGKYCLVVLLPYIVDILANYM